MNFGAIFELLLATKLFLLAKESAIEGLLSLYDDLYRLILE